MTRALALWLCRKEYPQGHRGKASKVFIKRKESTVRVNRHMGRLRGRAPELGPCGGLNRLDRAFLPVFLWPIILICLVHSPYWVYLRILPCVSTLLLAKMDSTKEAYGWHHSPLTSKGSFWAGVVEEVSWLWEWEMWCLGKAQPPLLMVLLFSS